MATLKEEAQEYTPTQIRNIAELDAVPLDFELKKATKKNSDGEEYSYNFIGLNGEEYRVPNSVLESLKTIITQQPNIKAVKVTKSGEGLGTRYTVLPLQQPVTQ